MKQHKVWLAVGFQVEAASREVARARAAVWLEACLRAGEDRAREPGLTPQLVPRDLDEIAVAVLQQPGRTEGEPPHDR